MACYTEISTSAVIRKKLQILSTFNYVYQRNFCCDEKKLMDETFDKYYIHLLKILIILC